MKKDAWIGRVYKRILSGIESQTNGIQMIVTGAFTMVACAMIILLSIVTYQLFSQKVVDTKTESAEQFLNQTKHGLEDYLRSNRRVSDALYYSCIKNVDFASASIDDELNLIYESNKDNVVRVALYTSWGELVNAVPVAQKENREKLISREWFRNALDEVENLHFSMPYVQNISDDAADGYRWVVTLSRAVEINRGNMPVKGVLVLDLKYSTIQQMIDKVNAEGTGEYIYLCDGDGNMIYHPKRLWMNAGHYKEKTLRTALATDGTTQIEIDDTDYIIVTKTVSYTGWKLVSVVPKEGVNVSQDKMRYFLVFFIAIAISCLWLINQQMSRHITRPLVRLDASIRDVESGNLSPDIYLGGPREIRHLSETLKRSLETIQELMDEVVEEQELKRQSELDALQSQINPHFLYNTLDSVIWMIEDEQNDGAVYMIKELSKLLRISINRGQSLIPIRDEIRHAKSYMNIQQVRYKDQFSCEFNIPEELLDCVTIKLIVQPLLENAITHGVQGMDDDGELMVRGYRAGDDVCIEVIDNGYGMSEEQIGRILNPEQVPESEEKAYAELALFPAKRGNGVGLKNVNTRIKMQFGPAYGLEIKSELGEGTTMRLRLPYRSYQEEIEALNQKKGREA